jgi:hypothetical protein
MQYEKDQAKKNETKLPAITKPTINNANFNMLESMDEGLQRNNLGAPADDVIAPINVRRRNQDENPQEFEEVGSQEE